MTRRGRPTSTPTMVAMRLPTTLVARIDAVAAEAGLSRAEWVETAVEAALADGWRPEVLRRVEVTRGVERLREALSSALDMAVRVATTAGPVPTQPSPARAPASRPRRS